MIRNSKYQYGSTDGLIPASINFCEYLLKKLHENKGKMAVINGITDERLMYDDILQGSMNFAVSLTHLGVGKGDMVGLVTENRSEFWSSIIGTMCTGATASLFNSTFSQGEFRKVIDVSKPKIMICSPDGYKTFGELIRSLPFVNIIILYGSKRTPDVLLYNDLATMIDDGHRSEAALNCDVTVDEFMPADVAGQSDVAIVLYSSGTTGVPKGVMVTHLNCLMVTTTVVTDLTYLNVGSWSHVFGLTSYLSLFANGKTAVFSGLMPMDTDLLLKTIEKYKIGIACVAPYILEELSKAKHSWDTSSLQLIICGASTLYEETIHAALRRFTSVKAILQVYGMTESVLPVFLNVNVNTKKTNSLGTVTAHTIAKVVDIATREPLGENEKGEICVKGPMIMKGYIGKDRSEDFDDEDFYRTGDVGYYDEEGYFYIVDRLKEIIKYKALQVSPTVVEEVLLQHEGIKEAGVVGVPDGSSGELPRAYVVPQPGVKLTEREIQEFVEKRLSWKNYLRGGVNFIERIPRNTLGKILRMELRKKVEPDS